MGRIMSLAVGVRPFIAAVVVLRLAVTATYIAQGLLIAGVLERLLSGEGVGGQAGRLTWIAALLLVRFGLVWSAEAVGQLTAARTKEGCARGRSTSWPSWGPSTRPASAPAR